MTIYKCDKCGKLEAGAKVTIVREHVIFDEDEYGNHVTERQQCKEKFDLCTECAQKVEKWIKGYYTT